MPKQNDAASADQEPRGAKRPAYRAYLIRCWWEGQNRRYSLETIPDRRRRGFDSLEALIETLRAELSSHDQY